MKGLKRSLKTATSRSVKKLFQAPLAPLRWNLRYCSLRVLHHWLDETGVIEEHTQFVDLRDSSTDLLLRAGDVLAVLSTA